MKKRNCFLTLVLIVALTLSAAACGNRDGNNVSKGGNQSQMDESAEFPSAEKAESLADEGMSAPEEVDAMAAAQENMNSVTSLKAQVLIEMDMTIGADGEEESVQSVTKMDMVCFSEPLKIKMEMSVDMGAAGSVTQSIYGEVAEDGTNTMYVYDGTNWKSQAVGKTDLEQYDARSNMLTFLDEGLAYTLDGMEQMNGGNAYKYSYVMTGAEMKEAMFSSGALDSVSSLGLDASQMDSMLDGLGEITAYVWIDEATLYPVKYEMDMTEVMNALMAHIIEAMGEQAAGLSMSVPKMKMTMTCFNFNNAADFTIPDEAKAN